jgi:hypothetical protein
MTYLYHHNAIGNKQRSLAAETTGANDTPSILTAIPSGRFWRVKAVHGKTVELLPAVFSNRLTALIAAARLAEHCGARVLP